MALTSQNQPSAIPPHFDPASWFVFLLRSDVLNGRSRQDYDVQAEFIIWWIFYGRKEYNKLSEPISELQKNIAWESVTSIYTDGARTPRILAAVLEARQDVRDHLRVSEPGGAERALAWFLIYGRREHELECVVSDNLRRWLAEPAESAVPEGGLTRLMAFSWLAADDLRTTYDLRDAEGLRAYMAWFNSEGHVRLQVTSLLSDQQLQLMRFPQMRVARSDLAAGKPNGVTLVGYAFGELGIGEDVRAMTAALSTVGVDHAVVDFSQGLDTRVADRTLEKAVQTGFPYSVTCFCLTGFDTARFAVERGSAAFDGRYVIGYWPWELPDWPEAWRSAFDLVDEIWVSSRFTQEAFALSAPVPVIHMPMAVLLPQQAIQPPSSFKRPPGRFLFLYVFDANSALDRKNPLALIRAFRRAFPYGNEPVGLVLKAMNVKPALPAWQLLQAECAQDPRIEILPDTITRSEVIGLMKECDAYVSLHRAEGFGRTIAEAMLLGKPVIATGWSGSDELVQEHTALRVSAQLVPVAPGAYPWGEGSAWANPDVDHAALCMRRLFADPSLRARVAAAGQSHVQRHFSPLAVGKRYNQRLSSIFRWGRSGRPGA